MEVKMSNLSSVSARYHLPYVHIFTSI